MEDSKWGSNINQFALIGSLPPGTDAENPVERLIYQARHESS